MRFAVLMAVTVMSVSTNTMTAAVLPELASSLGISPGLAAGLNSVSVLSAVLLTFAVGLLGDRLGRRRVLVVSLLLFGAAGALSATART